MCNSKLHYVLTLKEIMKLEILNDAFLLSGEENINISIESVSVLEVYEKILFIRHGELLISSLSGIKDNIDKQINTISMLHSIGAAGLVLCHVGFVMNQISPRLISHAQNLKFPIIVPNANVTFLDILCPCLDTLLFSKNKRLEEVINVLKSFDKVSSTNHSIVDILSSLEQIIGFSAYFIDPEHKVFSNYKLNEDLQLMYKRIQGKLARNKICFSHDRRGKKYFILPIISTGNYYGCLITETISFNANILYWTAIKKASTNIIFDNLHAIAQREYSCRITNELILEILTNQSVDKKAFETQANNLNMKIKLPAQVAILDLKESISECSKKNQPTNQILEKRIITVIQEVLIELNPLIVSYDDKYIIILPADVSVSQINKICQVLTRQIKSTFHVEATLTIGSKCNDIYELNSSFNTSLKALNASKQLLTKNDVISYSEMKIFIDVNDSLNLPSVEQITNQLSPLLDYDTLNKSMLYKTLTELVKNNYNLVETAKNLFVHKNTVLQRKNKIIEILGLNPFNYPYRTFIELAIFLITSDDSKE